MVAASGVASHAGDQTWAVRTNGDPPARPYAALPPPSFSITTSVRPQGPRTQSRKLAAKVYKCGANRDFRPGTQFATNKTGRRSSAQIHPFACKDVLDRVDEPTLRQHTGADGRHDGLDGLGGHDRDERDCPGGPSVRRPGRWQSRQIRSIRLAWPIGFIRARSGRRMTWPNQWPTQSSIHGLIHGWCCSTYRSRGRA